MKRIPQHRRVVASCLAFFTPPPLRHISTSWAFSNPHLSQLYDRLQPMAPAFPVKASSIKILQSPPEFYSSLIEGIRKAEQRIIISSLYLGTGDLERKMVDELRAACEKNPALEVVILLDYVRGTRRDKKGDCSACLLESLLAFNGERERIRIGFYHTPYLRGWKKRWLKSPFNELAGVQHIKAFVFDRELIMTGANLSESYFTTRKDRYMRFRDAPELADYYEKVVATMFRFSLRLGRDAKADKGWSFLAPAAGYHPTTSPIGDFSEGFRAELSPRLSPRGSGGDGGAADTWVFATLQMGQLGVFHDEAFTEAVLDFVGECGGPSSVTLSSPYFNLSDNFQRKLSQCRSSRVDIITSSPQANGFYGARGLAGLIPKLYSLLEQDFHASVASEHPDMSIYEYQPQPQREIETFHSKGLWVSLPEAPSCLASIGSPNFGSRSLSKDTEAHLFLLTQDPQLRRSLQDERDQLREDSLRVADGALFLEDSRLLPAYLKPITRHFFSNYL
eukprot:TRINITY_DN6194_c0_g1_i1.p1 TRINITY_DN6194_c0_g1~~TRINITY_DN6194_c0_g1_i1.p1  ORF type:complete len:506 (-),score=102.94 TRINITY_DN6194_c0_g1_i1:69-1586(-)